MHRPTVLHVVRDWVRPSERFVVDPVRLATATRPVVAYGVAHAPSPAVDVTVPRVAAGTWGRRLARLPRLDAERGARLAVAGAAVRFGAAVVHAHFGYWAGHAETAARRLGRPWAVSLHGHDLLVEAAAAPEQLERLARADLVVVPSAFLAGRAAALGLDADRIRVVPSGVDLAAHPFRERQPPAPGAPITVTFAGRFVAKKGVLDAIDALAAVQAAEPRVRAVVVGSGPLAAAVEQRMAATGLRAEVRDGAVPGAVAAAIAATDLLVTPSRTADDGDAETLGLVNLEAQAAGVPVVTTRHGGIPDAVARDGAVLVPEGDVAALTAALGDLVANPERWAAMGRAGRAHVASRFEVGAAVADLEAQWRALAATGAPLPAPRPPAERPTVSVIMVTHQRRDLVTQALDALAAQTYPRDRWEAVVVDNGTTDGTSDVLAAAADLLPLRVIRNAGNDPVAGARNAAARAATGEVLAFTDDDCRPVPTWLEALVAGLRDDVDVVQGRTTADPAQPLRPLSRTQFVPAEYGLYETCNIAYRRATFEAVGGFDDDLAARIARILGPRLERFPFGEDTDLAWRARRAGARTRFAVTAIVHHHVFPPDPRLLVRRAAIAAAFPALVRQVPELRDAFLWRRVWLGRRRPLFVTAVAAGAGAVGWHPLALLVAVPYAWSVLQPRRAGRRARLRALPVVVVRDAVEEAALLYGSVRARRLVL